MTCQSSQTLQQQQLLKCIAFCNPHSSKQKLSKILEFIETQKHNSEQEIFIYTPIEHIRFAKECKGLLGSLKLPKKSEIIIDQMDYASVENFKPFIHSFPESYSPFQIVIIVSENVQRAEIVLFPFLSSHLTLFNPSQETEYLHNPENIHNRHQSHFQKKRLQLLGGKDNNSHGSKKSKIMLSTECLIFCCFSYHCHEDIQDKSSQTERPIKLSFLSIHDEISHSQKFHESPLFPFPFKIQNLSPPSP